MKDMRKSKVVKVNSEMLTFDNGIKLYSYHEDDCCERHYLDFEDLTLADFEELEFDLSSDTFFERIEDYGIALKPIFGHPVRVPGYGTNNGCYSCDLNLVLDGPQGFSKFDITECQDITEP